MSVFMILSVDFEEIRRGSNGNKEILQLYARSSVHACGSINKKGLRRKSAKAFNFYGSPGWTRTNNPAINRIPNFL
jgi:hypothetical protein